MYQTLLFSSSLLILQVICTPQFHTHRGRRVCGRDFPSSVVMVTESYVQPVHKPYITLCQGHRICSTYKTTYSLVYRQVSRTVPISHSYPECCPGWRRVHSHNCNQAVCRLPCMNGGSCLKPDRCHCPVGWTGDQCQIDIDECSSRRPCSQQCLNTAGSYRCVCPKGFSLSGDGRSCQALPSPLPPSLPAPPTPNGQAGGHRDAAEWMGTVENVTEEVQSLRNRVELLEKQLQLVLEPFSNFFPVILDEGLTDKTSLLSHSFRQLDRIDSLSEQVGFLEERLSTCSCQEN